MGTNLALIALRNIAPDTPVEEILDRLVDALIEHDDDGDIHPDGTDNRIAELETETESLRTDLRDAENAIEALEAAVGRLQEELDALPDTE